MHNNNNTNSSLPLTCILGQTHFLCCSVCRVCRTPDLPRAKAGQNRNHEHQVTRSLTLCTCLYPAKQVSFVIVYAQSTVHQPPIPGPATPDRCNCAYAHPTKIETLTCIPSQRRFLCYSACIAYSTPTPALVVWGHLELPRQPSCSHWVT